MAVGIPATGAEALHRPAAIHQKSDVRLAPASLTSAPPGTRTGMETEEAVGTRKKKKRNNSGNDLGVSRTYGSTQFSMQRML